MVEGQPEPGELFIIKISSGRVEFLPAGEYLGLGTYDTTARFWERFGEKTGATVIGPAGEKRLTGASIQFADPAGRGPARAAGRGGLGALMGSKGVKAMVVDDRGTEPRLPLAEAEKFKAASQKWAKMLTGHPISGQALPAIVDMINARHSLALTPDDVTRLPEQILRDERGFNRDPGFTKAQDRLPDFFQEKIEAHQVNFDFTERDALGLRRPTGAFPPYGATALLASGTRG